MSLISVLLTSLCCHDSSILDQLTEPNRAGHVCSFLCSLRSIRQIIWAPLIVDGQISARLADAAVAFVSFSKIVQALEPFNNSWSRSQHQILHSLKPFFLLVLIGRNWSLSLLPCLSITRPAVVAYLCYVVFFFTHFNILRCSMFRWILHKSAASRMEICDEFMKLCWGLYSMYQPSVRQQIGVRSGGGEIEPCPLFN